TAPTVTNVSSSTANGTYGVGAVISIQVTFSSVVNVTGTPQLALNSGGTASYSSGSGTSTLTFSYTVAAGQNANPLDEASTSALSGTIKDAGGNAANLALPADGSGHALSDTKSIVIDTTAPAQTKTTTQLASSVSAPIPGQPVTLTATVSPVSPGAGTPTGRVDFFDTTTNTDLGSVQLSGGIATLTTSFDLGGHVITATYSDSDDNNYLGSQGSLTLSVIQSIYVLNGTANGALTLSGNASINVAGSVVVDSNSKTALSASGNADVTASAIKVTGGVQVNGHAKLDAPTTGVTPAADPLAGLAAPTAPTGSVAPSSVNLTKGSLTINPGVYSSISVSGNAVLTLNPGVYIIAGGGLSVTGNATIQGSGVTIYNAGSNYAKGGGGSFGAITVSGNATVNLSAPTSGMYAGIVIFQSRDNPMTLSFSGGSLSRLQGTIYAPDALLSLSGNVDLLDVALVVAELLLNGKAAIS
ncbi:MAG TPA: Ig-like domain-containing protein, partial [Gemmataceae bacterium]